MSTGAQRAVLHSVPRTFPIGAELLREGEHAGTVHVRVWAPRRRRVAVVLEGAGHTGEAIELTRDAGDDGYFSAIVPAARPGSRYRFKLDDDGGKLYPDPASRFQPDGVHGPSEIIDPKTFRWTDASWKGVPTHGQVLYEMHVGCFTPEGTWDAAIARLRREDRIFRRTQGRGDLDGAVIGPWAFVMRYFGEANDDRLLVINLDADEHMDIAPEPLMAPPDGMQWQTMLSTEHPKYGGNGFVPPETRGEPCRLPGENWRLLSRCVTVLGAVPADEDIRKHQELT